MIDNPKNFTKVTVDFARELYANAKNNGERAEALTLLELWCTEYAPYRKGSDGGDVYSPKHGHIQVKYYNGRFPRNTVITGDLRTDVLKAMEEDGSPTWAIWFNLDLWMLIDKQTFLDIVMKDVDFFFEYNKWGTVDNIRLKCGMGKRKRFMEHIRERQRAV